MTIIGLWLYTQHPYCRTHIQMYNNIHHIHVVIYTIQNYKTTYTIQNYNTDLVDVLWNHMTDHMHNKPKLLIIIIHTMYMWGIVKSHAKFHMTLLSSM